MVKKREKLGERIFQALKKKLGQKQMVTTMLIDVNNNCVTVFRKNFEHEDLRKKKDGPGHIYYRQKKIKNNSNSNI